MTKVDCYIQNKRLESEVTYKLFLGFEFNFSLVKSA